MNDSTQPENAQTQAGVPAVAAQTPADSAKAPKASRKLIFAWALWDWSSAAFNAVITTFVFTVYLTNKHIFGDGADYKLGLALSLSGILIALTAPASGQKADRAGRRVFWLRVYTLGVFAVCVGLFFVKPQQEYLWLGLTLVCVGNIFFELASVNYNAMLNDVATPQNTGRISGFGWGMGYVGGIVLLLFLIKFFIDTDHPLFGIPTTEAMPVRFSMLVCAAWTLIFSAPLMIMAKDKRELRKTYQRIGIIETYRQVFHQVKSLWQHDRRTIRFLAASAVFRDGLAGVFAFGGVIAGVVFGFTDTEVIIFGVAANVVAGIATMLAGLLEDVVGPKAIIMFSLISMVLAGNCVFFFYDHGPRVFWIFGLILCVFVGPTQAAARSFLARIAPEDRDGEVFGLYATAGRAVSFLAPALYSGAIALGAFWRGVSKGDSSQFGILGICLVLLLGLVLMATVTSDTSRAVLHHEPKDAAAH